MPNLNPAPDSPEALQIEQEIIAKDAVVKVYPYACITKDRAGQELVDMPRLCREVLAFSDDGSGVQSEEQMRAAMKMAKDCASLIAAHCEDETLLYQGYIHDGAYAAAHGHRGISSESEFAQICRDLQLVRETDCQYHVCHISTKESVELIRQAKTEGLAVSCETAPHYLVLCDEDLQEDGRFKMNPPIRSRLDREALISGLLDGTIDIIATDHAPHSFEEKSRGLEGSAMGIVGLETAFPVLYTHLVLPGVLTLAQLVNLMSIRPRQIFNLPDVVVDAGYPADLTLLNLSQKHIIDPTRFLSQGSSTPFAGWPVTGQSVLTMVNGIIVYQSEDF